MPRRRISSIILAFIIAFNLYPTAQVFGSDGVAPSEGNQTAEAVNESSGMTIDRLYGKDRVATSIAASREGWTSSETVILNEYTNYADAISATPLASQMNAPVLLTAGDKLDTRIIDELKRLQAKKVILLGGSGRLQPSIENGLTELNYKWERVGGADRYATSVLIAQKVSSDSMILVNGDDFPDALSAASFAGIKQIPILLLFILGGTGVVSGKIQAELEGKDFMKYLLTGKTVVVDPGHGSPDPGAKGPSGTLEKDNNLAIAQFLATELSTAGAKVILSRTNDNSPAYDPNTPYTERADLQKRIDIANENNADLFISIHNDSWKTAHGTTTYYSSENPSKNSSYELAQLIQSQLTQEIGTQNLGVKDSRFYVLRNNTMPAVLVEVAFISHPEEEKLLADDTFRKKAAQGISKGIFLFIRNEEGI